MPRTKAEHKLKLATELREEAFQQSKKSYYESFIQLDEKLKSHERQIEINKMEAKLSQLIEERAQKTNVINEKINALKAEIRAVEESYRPVIEGVRSEQSTLQSQHRSLRESLQAELSHSHHGVDRAKAPEDWMDLGSYMKMAGKILDGADGDAEDSDDEPQEADKPRHRG